MMSSHCYQLQIAANIDHLNTYLIGVDMIPWVCMFTSNSGEYLLFTSLITSVMFETTVVWKSSLFFIVLFIQVPVTMNFCLHSNWTL